MNKTQIAIKQEALSKLRGQSEKERLLHRLHSVVLVLHGYSASEAARIFEDSPRAVSYWVTRFKKSGIKGLQTEHRSGRPPALDEKQLKTLTTFFKNQERNFKPVNAEAVSQFIKEKFAVHLTERQCWRILKRLKA